MLSCSSRGEASFAGLGVCGQPAPVPALSSAPLRSANLQGLHGADTSCREGKALGLAPIILLGDGLDGSCGLLFDVLPLVVCDVTASLVCGKLGENIQRDPALAPSMLLADPHHPRESGRT